MSDSSEASPEDRQLEASERRLQEARAQGQVPRTREVAHLAAALALLAGLGAAGPWFAAKGLTLVRTGLRIDPTLAFDAARLLPRLGLLAGHGLLMLLPVLAGLALLFAAASIAIGGWNMTGEALAPKFERLDPLSGLVRMFGARRQLEHLRLVLAVAALLGAAAWHVTQRGPGVAQLARMPLAAALHDGFAWIAAGFTLVALACAGSALVDVPLQLLRHRAELRMTRDEARRESRENDGDPHLKGERRRRARERTRGRMLADVAQADVVVANPTHYAVALRYDPMGGGAPRIVASGTDLLALKIRSVATASRVPVLEAPPLARALWRHGEVGSEVPVALYTAVAQVLAWVYRLREGAVLAAVPEIDVPDGLDPGVPA